MLRKSTSNILSQQNNHIIQLYCRPQLNIQNINYIFLGKHQQGLSVNPVLFKRFNIFLTIWETRYKIDHIFFGPFSWIHITLYIIHQIFGMFQPRLLFCRWRNIKTRRNNFLFDFKRFNFQNLFQFWFCWFGFLRVLFGVV